MTKKTISLALGGGGVKGVSHIGVLRCLEKNDFTIEAIGATSMGALVGVLYGLGYTPDEMERVFHHIKRTGYSGQEKSSQPSFLGLRGFERSLRTLVGKRTFNDLKIPLIVTATEVKHGREVFIQDGSLLDAVLASVALPGIFPARRIMDMDLVDGGSINPVPVEAARSVSAPGTPVVAVVLTAPLGVPATMERIVLPRFIPRWLAVRIRQLRLVRAVDVFLLSQDMLNRAITKHNLDSSKPDLIIRPDVAHLYTLDTGYVTEIALEGDMAVRKAMPDLLRLFSSVSVMEEEAHVARLA
jgi:NTE family protein